MPVGAIGQGIASSFADYIGQERARNRAAEDAQITEHMGLIKALADRPDANPALLGKALHDLVDLQNAKGGQKKLKSGMAGFMGGHELPISQFLQGIQDGSTPIQGPTTELTGGHGQAGMIQPMYNQTMHVPGVGNTSGTDISNPPVPELPDFGMQPAKHQPLLRSPEEMAQQAGNLAGVKAGAEADAKKMADVHMWKSIGFSDQDIQAMLRQKASGKPIPAQIKNFMTPDGKSMTLYFHPDTSTFTDQYGTAVTPPTGARMIGVGPTDKFNFFTNDGGGVTRAQTNQFTGGTTTGVVPGVQGKTTPDGPTGVDPNTNQLVRFPHRGTVGTPMTVGGLPAPPAGTGTGAVVPGATVPQVGVPAHPMMKYNAEQTKIIDSIHQAQPMIDRTLALLQGNDSNSFGSRFHSLGQQLEYSTGFNPSDPVYQELIPLTSFLKVFLTQPYLRGIRNMTYVHQIQDHMPTSLDAPALIKDKLSVIQENMNGIMQELHSPQAPSATGVGGGADIPAPPNVPNAPGAPMRHGKYTFTVNP